MEGFRTFLEGWLRDSHTPQSRLAEETGIPASIISRWLSQRHPIVPSPASLRKLAPIIGVPYEDLMRTT